MQVQILVHVQVQVHIQGKHKWRYTFSAYGCQLTGAGWEDGRWQVGRRREGIWRKRVEVRTRAGRRGDIIWKLVWRMEIDVGEDGGGQMEVRKEDEGQG